MPVIEWKHDRQRILFPIWVAPQADAANSAHSIAIAALLDTGATSSGIRQDIIDELDLPVRGRRMIGTANGELSATQHLVRLGFYPGVYDKPDYPAPNQMPYVMTEDWMCHSLLPNFTFGMIVGMNLIGRTNFSIRTDGSVRMELPQVSLINA